MAKRKVIVVGGGMVGLFCADMLARKGHAVEVIERAEEVGGAYAPRIVAGRYYDNGVHVPGVTRQPDIDRFLFGEADARAEWLNAYTGTNVASYYNGQLGLDSPLPDLRSLDEQAFGEAVQGMGKSTLGAYAQQSAMQVANEALGPWVASRVVAPCLDKFYGSRFAEVAPHALEALHLRRVVAFDEAKSRELKQHPEWDACIGWPDAKAMRGSSPIYYYPKGSEALAPLVGRVRKTLLDLGVAIKTGIEVVQLQVRDGALHGFLDKSGTSYMCDAAVWALPVGMAGRLMGKPTSAPAALRQLWLAYVVVKREDLVHPSLHYVMCHDASVRLARVHFPDALSGVETKEVRVCAEYWLGRDEMPPQKDEVLGSLSKMGLLRQRAVPVRCDIEKSITVPVMTVAQQNEAITQVRALEVELPNMRCVGLGSSDRFFLADLLLHARDTIAENGFV